MRKAPSVLGWLLCVAIAMPLALVGAPNADARKATTSATAPTKPPPQNSAPPNDAASVAPLVPANDPYIKTFQFAPMGEVYVYLPKTIDDDTDVVLFASGDGGWEPRVVDMVVRMQALGKIVVGFSTPEYLKRLDASSLKCAYPPQELEALSQFVQRKLEIRSYRVPMLVGYSSGASLAYVAAAQTPINTFAGVIGLGFCEDLALDKPLCRQGALKTTPVKEKPEADGVRLLPIEHLVAPYELLQGQADEACSLAEVSAFMKQTDVTLHAVPKVGHGFSAIDEWFPQFLAAYKTLDERRPAETPPSSATLGNLPLIERPVPGGKGTFVVMLSGDGGWSTLTEKVTDELNADGYSVVGWNMLKYFWSAKTPEQAAVDLGTIVRYFTDAWHKQDVIVAGYSMGADVLPALVNRLPVTEQQRVRSIVLMAPERATDFEFHVSGWLHRLPKDAAPIAPEVANLPEGVKMTCIYGADEADSSLCTQVDPKKTSLTLKELPGAHHFDGDYEALAKLVR
jgi:type IV secretory pathway VirJ component